MDIGESSPIKRMKVVDFMDSNDERERWNKISLGCRPFDLITKGGISTRGITEIFGESAAGKTQILLQLSLMVQLPKSVGGLSKKAVFICTEDNFPSSRLYQLIKFFKTKYDVRVNVNYAENIFVEHVIEVPDLLNCICTRLPRLMAADNIGLVVLDSIAGAFRVESNIVSRAIAMRKLCDSLLNLCHHYKCAIVCSNQVTATGDAANSYKQIPCLGLSWANLVRTSIRISRTEKMVPYRKNDFKEILVVRKMKIEYSPESESTECEFLITSDSVTEYQCEVN